MELNPIKEYSVNPKAESLLNVCLTILLVLGWIVAIAAIAAAVFYAVEEEEYIYIGAGIPVSGDAPAETPIEPEDGSEPKE